MKKNRITAMLITVLALFSIGIMAGCASTGGAAASGGSAAAEAPAAEAATPANPLLGTWLNPSYGNVVFQENGRASVFDSQFPNYSVEGNTLSLVFGEPFNTTMVGTWEINADGKLVMNGFTGTMQVLNGTYEKQ
ncbi:MAG: hypothetical protein LBM77_14015 [Spirochaetaceae bacterium]|jgi:hypothetical protein|nr:hypothetical protein [Spirochaetaceae bacterium]